MKEGTLKSRGNSIGRKADHTSGSNSQAFGGNFSRRTSQSNKTTKRNSPWRQTSFRFFIVEKFRVHVCAVTVIILSVEVQSEHSTEENTCMTSSEHNQVSIPPKSFGIGLTDYRSCDSSQQLAFVSVDLYQFFCWKPAPVHVT